MKMDGINGTIAIATRPNQSFQLLIISTVKPGIYTLSENRIGENGGESSIHVISYLLNEDGSCEELESVDGFVDCFVICLIDFISDDHNPLNNQYRSNLSFSTGHWKNMRNADHEVEVVLNMIQQLSDQSVQHELITKKISLKPFVVNRLWIRRWMGYMACMEC